MARTDLIDSFFTDVNDYLAFFVGLEEKEVENDDGTCVAQFIKQDKCYRYKLTWIPDDKFLSVCVRPFFATEDNVKQFNDGCKNMADRLQIYIEKGDIDLVPDTPPTFGDLTYIK